MVSHERLDGAGRGGDRRAGRRADADPARDAARRWRERPTCWPWARWPTMPAGPGTARRATFVRVHDLDARGIDAVDSRRRRRPTEVRLVGRPASIDAAVTAAATGARAGRQRWRVRGFWLGDLDGARLDRRVPARCAPPASTRWRWWPRRRDAAAAVRAGPGGRARRAGDRRRPGHRRPARRGCSTARRLADAVGRDHRRGAAAAPARSRHADHRLRRRPHGGAGAAGPGDVPTRAGGLAALRAQAGAGRARLSAPTISTPCRRSTTRRSGRGGPPPRRSGATSPRPGCTPVERDGRWAATAR